MKKAKRDRRTGLLESDKAELTAKLDGMISKYVEKVNAGLTNGQKLNTRTGRMEFTERMQLDHTTSEGTQFKFEFGTLIDANAGFRNISGEWSKHIPDSKCFRPSRSRGYRKTKPGISVDYEADKAMRLYGHPAIAKAELERQYAFYIDEGTGDPEVISEYVETQTGLLPDVIAELATRSRGVRRKYTTSYYSKSGTWTEKPYDITGELKRLGDAQRAPGFREKFIPGLGYVELTPETSVELFKLADEIENIAPAA